MACHESQQWPVMVGIGQLDDFFASFPSTRGSLRRRSVQKHHAGAANTDAKTVYLVPAMQGSQFVVFCNISKHQKEIASGKGSKTLRGRNKNARG